MQASPDLRHPFLQLALIGLRVAVVVIFLGFGYTKFFPYEADALLPLFAGSPLIGWLPGLLGKQGASIALGCAELAAAVLLAARVVSPAASVLGAVLACGTFAVTLSIMLTAPDGIWEPSAGGFPALGGLGSFLFKDAVLLMASAVLLGESLEAMEDA